MGAVVDTEHETSYPTFADISAHARPYPVNVLADCSTGLCLFSAAYLGHNDVVHFAEAGIRTTCVDTDGDRLAAMRDLYPAGWSFVQADAWAFARAADEIETSFDAVSVDTFTGDAELRSLLDLEAWTRIARRAVTVTLSDAYGMRLHELAIPDGWTSRLFRRAPGAYWLVLTREES